MCMKADKKITALTTVKMYIDIDKSKILFQEFFESPFKYCPLTWMFAIEPQITESTSYKDSYNKTTILQ